ncbi:ATP-binding protein [Thermomonospora umbrina]|uniref:ATP-binding protein n=1 Tax=Thermomonospora umbrina TaxID=111806 RepID=UPI000E26D2CC|nr:ATP-binding protein [Thermomonospora umbrina]
MRASSVVLLPHAPSSVAVARRRLASDLRATGVRTCVIDDAGVIISELLSNALRHARPLPSGQIQVSWERSGDEVEVAVCDGGAMTEPRCSRPTLSSLGGRGLGIVEALAECWGVRHEDGRTTVWAVLNAPQPAPPTGGPVRGIAHATALADDTDVMESASPRRSGTRLTGG